MVIAHRLWLFAIFALVAVCAGLGYQLGVERGNTRVELHRVGQLKARLDARTGSPPTSGVHAASAPAVAAGLPSPPAPSPPPARVDPNVEQGQRMQAMFSVNARLSADPESRKLLVAEAKIGMRSEYPDVARRVHLSAAEADQLIELLADQRVTGSQTYAKQMATGSTPTFSQDDFDERRRKEEADLTALLGSEKFQRFQAYTESLPERRRVEAFQASLDEANTLSEDAAERMITALANEHASIASKRKTEQFSEPVVMSMHYAGGASIILTESDSGNAMESATAQMESYDRKMAQAAAPALSAAQLKAFTEFQRTRREPQLADLRITLVDEAQRLGGRWKP